MDEPEVVKACFEYFKNIEGMELFGSIEVPVTEYQKELETLSISPIELFIARLTEKNVDYENAYGEEILEILAPKLFADFELF